MQEDYFASRLKSASDVLPPAYRIALETLGAKTRCDISELRLRTGRSFSALCSGGEMPVCARDGRALPVTKEDILYVLDRATQSSIHSYANTLKNGFVTISGGHRIGICGSAIVKDGEVVGFKDYSSLSIRVAKEIKGISEELVRQIRNGGEFRGTLIASMPGVGKTTLLRDMIRVLSKTYRVGVADERSELAGTFRGRPQFDLGEQTDVIDSCPKDVAIMILIRTMNPQIVALDEITMKEDTQALLGALNCGVIPLATAHAEDIRDVREKPMYRTLIESGAFRNLVFIRRSGDERQYELFRLKEGDYA